ncbi:MAG: zf-HC2 domain-containing protein, partial [Actinomycetota bacterium]|nr:zf-HC2 domain-containing protein [Actinomycetota bacterium]
MTAPAEPHLGDALSALLDGELSAEEAAPVGAHLAVCEVCTRDLEAERAVRSRLRGLPPQQPPSGFVERLARSHHVAGRRRRCRVGVAVLGATAAASFAVLVL